MPSKSSGQDLFQLAHAGFPEKLSAYLQKNGKKLNVNEFSKDGATALIQCVQGSRVDPAAPGTDHAECCQIILRSGANPNLADKLGRTALHWAVFYKKAEFVRILLKGKGEMTKEDKKGQNVMQFAIRMNAAECLKVICDSLGLDNSSNSKILSKPSASVGTPLIQATKLGHKECCEILLQAGANIDIKDQTYFDKTSLHIATELNHSDIVEMLMKYDADSQAQDSQGNTILHLSCTQSSPRCLEVILSQGGKKVQSLVERRNKAGLIPLMVASQMGFDKHVKMLIEHNSPIGVQDESGKTALHHATEKGNRPCAELLCQADSGLPWTTDSEGRTPLHLAVIAGKKDLMEFLVQNSGMNLQDNQGHTPIHWAVVCGFHDLIDTLVEHGGDPSLVDDHGASPLHYAAQMCGDRGVSEIGILCLKALIKRGAKINAIDKGHKTPLLWAASAGSSEACKLLKEAGADCSLADLDGLTALHCAVTCNHSACVDTLLTECGCAADTPDKNGCTPLFYASSMDQADNVKALLDKGASPNYTDNKGKSPMHCAASSASLDALRLLKEHHGSMEQAGSAGETPFHEAVEKGDVDTIKFMIDNGCAPGSQDQNGRTPLHIAAGNANMDLCKYLVGLKVDIDAVYRNQNGLKMTPLDSAWDIGAIACMNYLASIGAKRGRELDSSSPQKQEGKPQEDGAQDMKTQRKDSQADNGRSSTKKDRSESRVQKQGKGSKDSTSPRDDSSKIEKSPYMKAPHSTYDHAEKRNKGEQQEAKERKNLHSTSVEKRLADWEGYIADHVDFLDDLLEVKHQRLESIQSHAIQEKEALVKKLEEIRGEMEKRMEKKASETEKLKEERRKQQADEKKNTEERWKKIQEQYLHIESKVSRQLTVHRQATQVMDIKMVKMEKKRLRREKTDLATARQSHSRSSASDDVDRTQKHQEWLKQKNKEYLEKKNAVKLKGPIKIDSATLNRHLARSSSPQGHNKSQVPSRINNSHRRRSPSPPHDRLRYQWQELEKQQRQLEQQHQQLKKKHSRPQTRAASITENGTTSSPTAGHHGNSVPSSASPHLPGSRSGHQKRPSGDGGGEGGGRRSKQSPAGSDSQGLTSHQLAQMRRSHGDSLIRKMWPRSRELLDGRARQEDEAEEIYDLKRHFSPRWDGKLRPRHVLQFRSSASGMSSDRRSEAQAEG